MTDLANQIKRLSAAATPGEWEIYKQTIASIQDGGTAANAKAELALQVDQTSEIGDFLYLLAAGDLCPATTGCGPTSAANAALIVALRNAVPQIIAALNAQAEVEVLRARVAELEARPLVTDAMVERAAYVIAGCGEPLGHFPDGSEMRPTGWNDYCEKQHAEFRAEARATLTAALEAKP